MKIEIIAEKLDNLIKQNADEHKGIFDQVSKTNGSVANLKTFKERLIGAFYLIGAIGIPTLIYIIQKYLL